MDLINVNLEEVSDTFEAAPEGVYSVQVKSAEWRKKDGGAYPYLNVTMTPVPGTVEANLSNKHFFVTLSMHPKALFNIKGFFTAAKMPLDLRNQAPEAIAQALTGRELRITVGTRVNPTNGNKDNEVKPPYHKLG